jgi:hypothetical protein
LFQVSKKPIKCKLRLCRHLHHVHRCSENNAVGVINILIYLLHVIFYDTLAQQALPADFPICNDTVNPMLQHVLDSLEFSPATILDVRFNVISWNRAAAKVLFDYGKINASKRNLLRIMFTNEEYKKTIADWESTAKGMIARFRSVYGKFVGDPWIEDFINELRSESKGFDSWWPMHDVKIDEEILKTINHPVLGQLKFEYTSFQVISDSNLKLTVLTALPGSDTEEKIKQFLLN